LAELPSAAIVGCRSGRSGAAKHTRRRRWPSAPVSTRNAALPRWGIASHVDGRNHWCPPQYEPSACGCSAVHITSPTGCSQSANRVARMIVPCNPPPPAWTATWPPLNDHTAEMSAWADAADGTAASRASGSAATTSLAGDGMRRSSPMG
jgi:hypothetical protein